MRGAPIPNNGFHNGRLPDRMVSKDHFHHGINWVAGVPQNNTFPVNITGDKRIIGRMIIGRYGSWNNRQNCFFFLIFILSTTII
jgi:hypothetical protein